MNDNLDENQQSTGEGNPHISVNAQYIKEISFENPSDPHILSSLKHISLIKI